MTDCIQTKRLLLRPLRESDIGAVTTALQNHEVVRMLPGMPWPYAEEDARDFILNRAPHNPLTFAIDHDDALIGVIGDTDHLGYWLAQSAWGSGFATEAARAVVALRFSMDATPIRSGHRLGNLRSRRVLEKLGFCDVGRHEVYCNAEASMVTLQDMELSWADRQALQ